jgi:thiazole/oxazole-forming peptide maturase SagD family component
VDDAQLYWVKGINESTGSTCHIPAQCIFWNYINTAKKHTEPVLGDINTSGAAAHVTIEKWKKSALFELIERDGFITCWLKKIPPTRIDVFTVTSEQIKNYIAQLHGSGFKIYLLNTTSTLRIPSVTAVLIDPTNIGPYVTVAAAAAENFEKAIEKAIGEVMGSYALIRSKDWQKLYVTYDLGNKAFKEFDQGDRLIWWANKKNASNIDYFLSGAVTPIREAESGAYCPESYAELLKHCSSNGYRVYSYTVSDLRLEKIGFKVGKLISPDFNNLYLDEVNKTQSIVTLDIDINCLNDVPHPFP